MSDIIADTVAGFMDEMNIKLAYDKDGCQCPMCQPVSEPVGRPKAVNLPAIAKEAVRSEGPI
ncbi:hypothetical protein LCGC14_0946220 [marine sediment metagenome]|uniref:Uncharacterized protein n=1 Tax=marine sediment metagenome TaxID=412755 RepID=A0A0F9R289_9ZZZZ